MHSSQCRQHDERADAVVDATTCDDAVAEIDERHVDHARIADANATLFYGIPATHADVDPEIVNLGDFIALFAPHQMNRFLADDTDNITGAGEQADALADQ